MMKSDCETGDTFAARVVAWQREHGRCDLPWQQTRDAYRIWLSEIMLQQTQVVTVLRYYPRFVDAFPDVGALAAAPLSRVLELWSGLGYYRRAHHLHAAARSVVDRFNGRFPVDAANLTTLPGIGRSTAAAIAAFASNERGAILDGNVKRVLARHRGIDGWPGEPRVEALLWRAADALLPKCEDIATYTQGMMDVGATICTRSRPRCERCPVAVDCVARRDARIDELPAPRPRKALPRREVAVLLIEHDRRILLERRPDTGVWPGLLGLPELPIDADIAAAVTARFGRPPVAMQRLPRLTHAFTHFVLDMQPVRVVLNAHSPHVAQPSIEWLSAVGASRAAVPAPVRTLLLALRRCHDINRSDAMMPSCARPSGSTTSSSNG
jgi:A/G-specific adenine glycosylase